MRTNNVIIKKDNICWKLYNIEGSKATPKLANACLELGNIKKMKKLVMKFKSIFLELKILIEYKNV